MQKLMGKMM